jgi:quercetin dioxygenase-like cupin family protein
MGSSTEFTLRHGAFVGYLASPARKECFMPGFRARPPAEPTILLDDAVVRVTRWDFVPGADTGHHVHGLGYVVVPMTDCKFLIEEEGGDRWVDMAKGQVYRREAGVAHNVVNGGDDFMSFIEIEYK